jgi:VanZ family protein
MGPVPTLLDSAGQASSLGDFLANILLYLPLGLFAAAGFGRKAGALTGISLAVASGACLSIAMELGQYYVPGRVTTAEDCYANVVGTALGAVAGSVVTVDFRSPALRQMAANPVPGLLLVLWLLYRLFPYVPTIDLHKYWDALKPVILYPRLTGYELFRFATICLTLGALVEGATGRKRAWLLFPLFIGTVLIAKVLIVGQVLKMAEIAGAGLGLAVWAILTISFAARTRTTVIGLLLSASIIIERLAPFQLSGEGRAFGWIPFASFIDSSLEVAVISFFEKTFLYGSWVWLLGRSGLGFAASTMIVAATLFGASWAETYLPSRSAEITDAIMALVVGGIIVLLEGAARRGRTPLSEG